MLRTLLVACLLGGSGAALATEAAAHAQSDGYTILFTTPSHTMTDQA